MNYQNEIMSVAQDVINSPRTLAGVAGATSSLSIVNIVSAAQSWLTITGILLGAVATILLIRIHLLNYKNTLLQNKILTRQAEELDKAGAP